MELICEDCGDPFVLDWEDGKVEIARSVCRMCEYDNDIKIEK